MVGARSDEENGFYGAAGGSAQIEPAGGVVLTQSEMDAEAIAKITWDKFASISPEDEKQQIELARQTVQQAYAAGVNLTEFEEILRNTCPPGIQEAMREQFIRHVEAEGRKPEYTRDQQRAENDREMAAVLQGVFGGAEKVVGFTALGEVASGASAGLGATTAAAGMPFAVKGLGDLKLSFLISPGHEVSEGSLFNGISPGHAIAEMQPPERDVGTFDRSAFTRVPAGLGART